MDRQKFDGKLESCKYVNMHCVIDAMLQSCVSAIKVFGGVSVSPLLAIVVAIWAISGVALIVLVLMHSGKGTGLSEAFSGIQSTVGTGIIEKNLNRATIITAIIFIVTLVVLMLIWP